MSSSNEIHWSNIFNHLPAVQILFSTSEHLSAAMEFLYIFCKQINIECLQVEYNIRSSARVFISMEFLYVFSKLIII